MPEHQGAQANRAPGTDIHREAVVTDRMAGAAKAIRSPAPVQQPSAQHAGASGDAGAARPGASSAASAQKVTPAAELFSAFVEDDPKNVFLSATAQYHAAVQSETIDPEWAPRAASALRDYITAQFGDRYEVPLVDCRLDLCEMRIAARSGGDAQADLQKMQEAMYRIKGEPWWLPLEFDQDSGSVGVSPDGRALVLWFFSRR
jgi:hypothetical protein